MDLTLAEYGHIIGFLWIAESVVCFFIVQIARRNEPPNKFFSFFILFRFRCGPFFFRFGTYDLPILIEISNDHKSNISAGIRIFVTPNKSAAEGIFTPEVIIRE